MKAIIGVKAASNRGKTLAIVRATEILKSIPSIVCHEFSHNPKECACVCIWDGRKIGMFSDGDTTSAVKRNLDLAKDCDITVLALHGGASEKYIRTEYAENDVRYLVTVPCYKNSWLVDMPNDQIDNDRDKNLVVDANAAQIISLITRLK